MRDISALIGIPYSKMDCWKLCQEFYSKILNKKLETYFEAVPEHREQMKALVNTHQGEFFKVKSPKFGDLILIKIRGIESHIGVFLYDGLFLHTSTSTGSVVDRIARWSNMIVGYYSLDKGQND